jgi:uncharacterized protein (DUF736 family)
MTCKFCGSTIDDNVVECPYCGHKTGVGAPADPAAEMTDKFAAQGTQDNKQAKGAKSSGKRSNPFGSIGSAISVGLNKTKSGASGASKTRSSGGSRSPVSGNGLIAIGLVACLLLCLISIISVAGMKKDLENMNQEMLSLFYQIQNSTDKLQQQVNNLEASIGNVSTTITEQTTSRNITITKEPTSVATYVGRGAADDDAQNVPIFTVYAQGFELKFAWQKYDDVSGEWIEVALDNESNNAVYGLHVYTDASKGYSELSAHGVTQAAYGTYRCQVADSYGIKNTASVLLTERSKDEAPTT